MQFYTPRRLMFKVWNQEERLLIRLDSIPCVKGEIFKKDHVFLQFTGAYDMESEDLYEMDIVFRGKNADQYVIRWNSKNTGWCITELDSEIPLEDLTQQNAQHMRRLCSFFESTLNSKP